jgi:hypothetical protein
MASAPGDRFRSAAEMMAALEACVPAAPPPALEEPPPSAPRPLAAGSMLDRPDLPPPPPRPAPAAPESMPFDVEVEAPTVRRQGLTGAEAEEIQPAERGGRASRVVGLVFVILAFVVGGVLLYYMLAVSQDSELPPVATPDAQPSPPPDVDAEMARIRLSGLPPGAVWFDNDKRLSANPFRVRKSRAVHTIRVEAPGYEPYETRMSFGGDQEIHIIMTALPDTGDAAPFQFKSYTSGPGANRRVPRKGPVKTSITPIKQPAKSIDALREHNVSTPGRTAPAPPTP